MFDRDILNLLKFRGNPMASQITEDSGEFDRVLVFSAVSAPGS